LFSCDLLDIADGSNHGVWVRPTCVVAGPWCRPQALAEHLDDLEERYWADDVIDRWESSGSPSRPLEDLKAELGL